MGCSKSSSKREVYSDTILPPKNQEKHRIDNLTLHLKQMEKKKKKNDNNKLAEGNKS